jgi:hypothetical protein
MKYWKHLKNYFKLSSMKIFYHNRLSIMSFKPDCMYQTKILNVIFYSIDYLYTISFLIRISHFILLFAGLKRQTSIHLLYEVLVQQLRMLVQSESHSHTEYVHFEPSPVMVSLGSIKDFHVVRAKVTDQKYYLHSFHILL